MNQSFNSRQFTPSLVKPPPGPGTGNYAPTHLSPCAATFGVSLTRARSLRLWRAPATVFTGERGKLNHQLLKFTKLEVCYGLPKVYKSDDYILKNFMNISSVWMLVFFRKSYLKKTVKTVKKNDIIMLIIFFIGQSSCVRLVS